MFRATDDLRIATLKPLIPPAILMEEHPLTEHASQVVASARDTARNILTGQDKRLLVIVGPCSIHDVDAARVRTTARWCLLGTGSMLVLVLLTLLSLLSTLPVVVHQLLRVVINLRGNPVPRLAHTLNGWVILHRRYLLVVRAA